MNKTYKVKKIISMLLTIILVISSYSFNLLALNTEEPNERFIEICNSFFSDPIKYRALDKGETDITNTFYNNHLREFNAGNYGSLWNACLAELSGFCWDNEPSLKLSGIFPRAILTLTHSETFVKIGYIPQFEDRGFTYQIEYTINGNYVVNDGSQIILSANADITFDAVTVGAQFNSEFSNISTNARISSNQKTVTFQASFIMKFYSNHYLQHLGDVPYSESFSVSI